MSRITYGRLDEILRSMGFLVLIKDQARWYTNEPSGAVIAFADLPDTDEVLQRHLVMVRRVIGLYGLDGPPDFEPAA